mmetsp:Transcript_8281/g.24869  ORF Transcript_8281/g.24869 Transcript_8281/m.24869 type:complete len:330 (-) Transcript_8281:113-1102(-)
MELGFVPTLSVVNRPRRRCVVHMCTQQSTQQSASQTADVPRSLEAVLVGAVNSVDDAAATGVKKMRVTMMLPGMNSATEQSFRYNEELLFFSARALATCETFKTRNLSMLYASAGTGASARRYYERSGNPLDENVKTGSTLPRDVQEGGENDAYIIVEPRNRTGDPVILAVDEMTKKAPEAIFVLLNPFLEHNQANVASSILETDRRRRVLESFVEVFLVRPLYYIRRPSLIAEEIGLLYRRFNDKWKLYAGSGDDLSLVEVFDEAPPRQKVSALLSMAQEERLSGTSKVSSQEEKRAEQVFLVVLASLSAGVAVAAAFLAKSSIVPMV